MKVFWTENSHIQKDLQKQNNHPTNFIFACPPKKFARTTPLFQSFRKKDRRFPAKKNFPFPPVQNYCPQQTTLLPTANKLSAEQAEVDKLLHKLYVISLKTNDSNLSYCT